MNKIFGRITHWQLLTRQPKPDELDRTRTSCPCAGTTQLDGAQCAAHSHCRGLSCASVSLASLASSLPYSFLTLFLSLWCFPKFSNVHSWSIQRPFSCLFLWVFLILMMPQLASLQPPRPDPHSPSSSARKNVKYLRELLLQHSQPKQFWACAFYVRIGTRFVWNSMESISICVCVCARVYVLWQWLQLDGSLNEIILVLA